MNTIALLLTTLTPLTTPELLQRTGKALEALWDQLAGVNCVETVEQEKLSPDGKVLYRGQSAFDYLAVLQLTGNDLIVDESRAPLRQAAKKAGLPLLLTSGFSTFAFIFHPFYQGGFEYSTPRQVEQEGRNLLEVHFRQARGGRSPTALKVGRQEYPIPWEGTAWIDPQTAAIVRISAALLSSMEDVGLRALAADVRYQPVRFQGDSAARWLPASATVEVQTARQRWRNVHTFANYRLFSVDVKQKVEAAQ